MKFPSAAESLRALDAAMSTAADVETIREAQRLVSEQAEDDGLWFIAESVVEGYFQQELRRLHAAVEAVPLARLEALALRGERLEEALAAYRSALRSREPESDQLRALGDAALATEEEGAE